MREQHAITMKQSDVDNGSRYFISELFIHFTPYREEKGLATPIKKYSPINHFLNPFAYNQKAFMIFFEIVYNADLCFLPVIHIKTSFLEHFFFK